MRLGIFWGLALGRGSIWICEFFCLFWHLWVLGFVWLVDGQRSLFHSQHILHSFLCFNRPLLANHFPLIA